MLVLKIATVFLLALLARADKKIELLDIEEDNLRNEKDKEINKSDPFVSNINPKDFFKYGFMQYIDSESKIPVQQQRYVQQYAVTEPPEAPPTQPPQPQYHPAVTGPSQQAMIGYLSNIPMNVYIVPEFANNRVPAATNYLPTTAFAAPQNIFKELPLYLASTNPQMEQTIPEYSQQVAYVTLASQPTLQAVPAQINAMTAPANGQSYAYPIPLPRYYTQNALEYQAAVPNKVQFRESNRIEEPARDESEDEKEYYSGTQTETPFVKPSDYPRYYSSSSTIRPATSLRDDAGYGQVAELPRPNPLLLRAPPSRYALIPKTLPLHRPPNPVYSGVLRQNALIPKRPASLLDSYVPSSLQYEYLKRGYNKDHLSLYEALYNSRQHPPYPHPRKYERGFVPNQVFQTGSGGVTFAHYKRAPKSVKS